MDASGWEIVDLGENTWEVIVSEAERRTRQTLDAPRVISAGTEEIEVPPEALLGRLARTDRRLDALEQRLGELGDNDQRVNDLEQAQAKTERRLDEQDKAIRAELEEIYRQAERAVAETQVKPGWRQRRHEAKLARLERDRKIRRAERRLAEQAEDSLARIGRERDAAEQRVRVVRDDAERELDSAAVDVSMTMQDRLLDVLDNEDRLVALMDRIGAAEERLRVADERALAARDRTLGPDAGVEL